MSTRLPYFLLFFVWISGHFSQIQAQTPYNPVQRYVISSAGQANDTVKDEVTGTALWILEWSIGEVLVEPLRGSKKRLSQGFHQPLWTSKNSNYQFSVLDQENIKQHFTVFPNPAVNHLSVAWDFEEDLNLLFEIFSLDGRRVFSYRQNAKKSQLLIPLNNLTPKIYVLRISDPLRGFLETHKIVKL